MLPGGWTASRPPCGRSELPPFACATVLPPSHCRSSSHRHCSPARGLLSRRPARLRWGARRRREALAALAALNVSPRQAVFFGLPDHGLTALLLTAREPSVALLAAEIAAWSPTIVVAPSYRDRHPDHSALAIL